MHTEFARGNVMERDQLELLSVDAVLKRILKEQNGTAWDGITWRRAAGCCEHDIGRFGSVQGREFVERLASEGLRSMELVSWLVS